MPQTVPGAFVRHFGPLLADKRCTRLPDGHPASISSHPGRRRIPASVRHAHLSRTGPTTALAFSDTLQPPHHSHRLYSKEGRQHQACYMHFAVRSVFLPCRCYRDMGNCLSIWQSIARSGLF